jgi:Sulfotransferase family
MAHLLRYGASVHTSLLRANPDHNFAHTFAMLIYDSNAVYSMIPKNGCTTMRVSIARANGILADLKDWEWIHRNNDTFRPTLKELALASFRYTVLRCPYSRIVSCFLDKIVKRTPDATQFVTATKEDVDLDKLTFRRFCDEMTKPAVLRANMHWRPQVDFLVYADYDAYYCFEDFARIPAQIKSAIGFNIIDARPLAKHDSSHYKIVRATQSFADTPLPQIEAMLLNGFYPQAESFYDESLFATVAGVYKDDFALYRKHFPGMGMIADQDVAADPWLTAV